MCVLATAHVYRSEDNFQELVLSFNRGSRDGTQVIGAQQALLYNLSDRLES